MVKQIKKLIKKNKCLFSAILFWYSLPNRIKLYFQTQKILACRDVNKNAVFYIGIPAHANLGDLAQGVCIRRWLSKHFSDRQIIEIETNALVNTSFSLLKKLKRTYRTDDIIVFQSGYTTTDLGGHADEMHRAVMDILPQAKMLMLPQTIFFLKEENKKRTSDCYNKMANMLFLARDRVSYEYALEMFPDIRVKQYPDIVTTLIGTMDYGAQREGIMFCLRNDSEKFYSDEELSALMNNCSKMCRVDRIDTTKKGKVSDIVKNAKNYIYEEIEKYSHYKAIITDRYHGTIFSLVAGTPVIIIKTTDHKVTTGAEWFKGIYDGYVYVAETLEQAEDMAKEILSKEYDHKLNPYFEKEYYDKLPEIFTKEV